MYNGPEASMAKCMKNGRTSQILQLANKTSPAISTAIEQPGQWVIRVAYVLPCEDCKGTVWDTYYATFSFHLPGA